MPSQVKCPICGTEMKVDVDQSEGVTYEVAEICPKGCYEYEYMTGSTRISICGREWIGSYTDPPEKDIQDRREREQWIKEHRHAVTG